MQVPPSRGMFTTDSAKSSSYQVPITPPSVVMSARQSGPVVIDARTPSSKSPLHELLCTTKLQRIIGMHVSGTQRTPPSHDRQRPPSSTSQVRPPGHSARHASPMQLARHPAPASGGVHEDSTQAFICITTPESLPP